MGVPLWLQMNCWSRKGRKKIIEVADQIYFCELWCWQSCSFTGLTPISIQQQPANGGLSNSSTSLPTTLAARPQSLPGPEHLLPLTMNAVTTINNTAALTLCNLDTKPSGTPDNQIREDFAILAKDSKLFTTCCLTCWLSSELDLRNSAINFIGKYVNCYKWYLLFPELQFWHTNITCIIKMNKSRCGIYQHCIVYTPDTVLLN